MTSYRCPKCFQNANREVELIRNTITHDFGKPHESRKDVFECARCGTRHEVISITKDPVNKLPEGNKCPLCNGLMMLDEYEVNLTCTDCGLVNIKPFNASWHASKRDKEANEGDLDDLIFD